MANVPSTDTSFAHFVPWNLAVFLCIFLYVAKDYKRDWRNGIAQSHLKHPASETTGNLADFGLLRLPVIPLAIIYLSFRLAWAAFRMFVFTALDLLCFALELYIDVTRRLPETSIAIANAIPPIWNVWVALPVSKRLHSIANWCVGSLLPRLATCTPRFAKLAMKTWVNLMRFKSSIFEALEPVAKSLAAIGRLFVVDPFVWFGRRGNMLCSLACRCLNAFGKGLWRDVKDLAFLLSRLTKWLFNNVILPVAKLIVKGAAQMRPILHAVGTTFNKAFTTVLAPSAAHVFWQLCLYLQDVWGILSGVFVTFGRRFVTTGITLSYLVIRTLRPVCLYASVVFTSINALFWTTLPRAGSAFRSIIVSLWDNFLVPIARLTPKLHRRAVKVSAYVFSVILTITLGLTDAMMALSRPIIDFLASIYQFALVPMKATVLGLAPLIQLAFFYITSKTLKLVKRAYALTIRSIFPGIAYIVIETANLLTPLTKPAIDAVATCLVMCIAVAQNIILDFAGRLWVAIRSVDVWMAEEAVPIALAARQSIAHVAEQAVEKCQQMMVDYIKHETSAT